jgi:hypothetical protein
MVSTPPSAIGWALGLTKAITLKEHRAGRQEEERMKITKGRVRGLAIFLVATWTVLQARASYNYTIGDGGMLLGGFSVALDGVPENGILVGGIQATADDQAAPGFASFTTVCLDLQGRLYLGATYAFDEEAFSGQTGLNPTWGNPHASPPGMVAAYQGINNAAFLFATHENVSNAGDWAALQLSVWKALYDSDANGNIVWGSNARFTVQNDPTQGSAAWAEAQDWLGGLPRDQDFSGYLLKPADTSAQELIITSSPVPVPEPKGLTAVVLLLGALWARAGRVLRNRRRGCEGWGFAPRPQYAVVRPGNREAAITHRRREGRS